MKSRVVTPIAEPVASLPCRKAFEGGQTSGLKAVKTQPSVPKPARTVKSQVLRPLAEAVASGWKAFKTDPIVPKLAGKRWQAKVWGLPTVARLAEKQWKAELWRPSQSQWQAYPAGKPLKAAKRPDWKPLNQSPGARACRKNGDKPSFQWPRQSQRKASGKLHAYGDPRRRPCLGVGRGRRIYKYYTYIYIYIHTYTYIYIYTYIYNTHMYMIHGQILVVTRKKRSEKETPTRLVLIYIQADTAYTYILCFFLLSICLFVYLFIYVFICLLIYSFLYLFVHLFVYLFIDKYKTSNVSPFFGSLYALPESRQAAQNDMDTGIPMVGKHAETHRTKVLKRYRSIVDAWHWKCFGT